jgi:hypothetical protein
MSRAQASYLRIYSGSTNYQLWQSYYTNSTISLSGLSWSYFPFNADGMISSGAAGGNAVSITCPAVQTSVDAFNLALARERLCELKVYEFDSRLSNVLPQSGQTLIISFLGVVNSLSGDFNTLSIELGSSLSRTGSQAPPRKFTSYQIGAPIQL